MVETIENNGRLIAIIVTHHFKNDGITFFTPPDLSQQLAYLRHPVGKKIEPHYHIPAAREVLLTQETLLIKRGRLRVDFYDDERNYVESRVLEAGDVILLVQGGHGFEVLEEVEIFEVKQGPYKEADDKVRFAGQLPTELKLLKS
jgi:hypothetical protein